MSATEKQQIQQRMQEKDTEELLDIWKRNDRSEWTDVAFEVVREILVERIGEAPPQNTPGTDVSDEEDEEDTFHNTRRITLLAEIALKLSWLFVIWGVVFTGILYYQHLQNRYYSNQNFLDLVSNFGAPLMIPFLCVFMFVLCRAIGEGLYVLLDIEANSRPKNDQDKLT
jgi:hypothetical protein